MTHIRRHVFLGCTTVIAGLLALPWPCASQTVTCHSPETTALLREAFATSGPPAAALVFAVAENNPEYAELAFSAVSSAPPILKNLDAFARSRNDALDVKNIVTKEGTSPRAAMCQADLQFKPSPPPDMDAAAWDLAIQTHWTIDYTATINDANKPAVALGPAKCDGPACEIVARYQSQVRDALATASTALKTAQKTANETSAVGVMRTIQIGQSVFSEDCAGGFFAPSLTVLAAAPKNFDNGFIPAELRPPAGQTRIESSGYYFEISKDGSSSPEATCNGFPAGIATRGYTALASPKDDSSGSRHFMLDSRGEIMQGTSKTGPWEPLK